MYRSPSPDQYVVLAEHPDKEKILDLAPSIVGRAASRLASREKGAEWFDRVDLESVMEQYHQMADGGLTAYGLRTVILAGSHLFTFSFSSPWFNPKQRWIVEQFFARIGRGPSSSAFVALDALARDLNASAVVMATAFAPNDATLGKLYEQNGYKLQSSQYIKDHAWPQSQLSSPVSPPLPPSQER